LHSHEILVAGARGPCVRPQGAGPKFHFIVACLLFPNRICGRGLIKRLKAEGAGCRAFRCHQMRKFDSIKRMFAKTTVSISMVDFDLRLDMFLLIVKGTHPRK